MHKVKGGNGVLRYFALKAESAGKLLFSVKIKIDTCSLGEKRRRICPLKTRTSRR